MLQITKIYILKIDKIGLTRCRSGLFKHKFVCEISFAFQRVDLSVRTKGVFINVFSYFAAGRTL
jgi:hypothetical protein